jgi:hypothetical protein
MPSTAGIVSSANRSLEIAWLTTVAADNPFGWWKSNDTGIYEIANSGSSAIDLETQNMYFASSDNGTINWQQTGIVNYSGNKGIYTTDGDSLYYFPCIYLGGNQYLNEPFGRDINNANAFTMECIIKLGDNTSRFTYGRQEANALGWGMLITQTAGKFYVTAWVGNLFAIGVDGDTGVTIDYNKWYHIVYTYESTRSRLYINGTLVLEKTFASYTWPQYYPINRRDKISLISSYPQSLPIGGTYDPTINAYFDELVMYKSTLSYTQVAEHAFASGVLSQ